MAFHKTGKFFVRNEQKQQKIRTPQHRVQDNFRRAFSPNDFRT